MRFFSFLLLSSLVVLSQAAFVLGQPANVVMIVADDMGYADCGVNGCRDFPTQHIDSIAAHGVRCTRGYVTAPVCSPSRAGLMTGRYQQRFGHELNLGHGKSRDPILGLPVNEVTIAQHLKSAGYRTGLVGKWHLGGLKQFHPNERGFDEFFGFLMGQHSYFPGPLKERESPIQRNAEIVDESEYLTDAFGREAVAFIERASSGPFFLYVAFNAPHVPLEATESYLARVPNLTGRRQTYAAMMIAMDDAIGRILDSLRSKGLFDKTLVTFISDNGGPPGNGSSNGVLRGYKTETYEGGIRVPFLLQFPGRLPVGTVYDHPVISLDIASTVLSVAQAPKPPDIPLDGVNLIPFLSGDNANAPHEHLFWRFGKRSAAIHGNHKLVLSDSDDFLLFDLNQSPSEELPDEKPQVKASLSQAWAQWSQTLAKPLWGAVPER